MEMIRSSDLSKEALYNIIMQKSTALIFKRTEALVNISGWT